MLPHPPLLFCLFTWQMFLLVTDCSLENTHFCVERFADLTMDSTKVCTVPVQYLAPRVSPHGLRPLWNRNRLQNMYNSIETQKVKRNAF